jgi:hypothetical protein
MTPPTWSTAFATVQERSTHFAAADAEEEPSESLVGEAVERAARRQVTEFPNRTKRCTRAK